MHKVNIKKILIFTIFLFLGCLFVYTIFRIYPYLKIGNSKSTLCPDCNVVIVGTDSLSADHLPCYGYSRNTSPNLCKFADENILFSNAYANSYWTLPTDVSLLSGFYPNHTKVINFNDYLNKNIMLYPQLLKSLGYESMLFMPVGDVAFLDNKAYSSVEDMILTSDLYDWEASINKFKSSVKNGKKTFMYLHSYTAHFPYLINGSQIYSPINTKLPTTDEQFWKKIKITPEFARQVVSDLKNGIDQDAYWQSKKEIVDKYSKQLLAANGDYDKELPILQKMQDEELLIGYQSEQNYINLIDLNNKSDINALIALYDQSINILDNKEISQIVELANNPEFSKNTIFIIYSEHGEEFMKHGNLFHSNIYNENVKIPLVMKVPGISKTKVSTTVQLVDIVPTLNDLLGIKNNIKYDGYSLKNNLLGLDKGNELINIDGPEFNNKALIYYPWKLFLSLDSSQNYKPYELYNLQDDPSETNNVLFQNIKIADKIFNLYKNR